MIFVRRTYKILLLLVLNIFFLLPGLLISASFILGKSRQMQLRTYGMMLWAQCLAAVLGLKIQASGERPYRRGLFIACNHCSYTDVLVIGSIMPAVFVAKAEVISWPVFGWLAKIGGTIFVNREAQRSTLLAVREAEEILAHSVNVVIFPEGTTDNGTQVDRFKSSFFRIPVTARLPVLPVSICYTSVDGKPPRTTPANEMAWHNMPLFPHFLNLLSKKRIDVRVHFNEAIDGNMPVLDRKKLADIAHQRITEGFRMLQEKATG